MEQRSPPNLLQGAVAIRCVSIDHAHTSGKILRSGSRQYFHGTRQFGKWGIYHMGHPLLTDNEQCRCVMDVLTVVQADLDLVTALGTQHHGIIDIVLDYTSPLAGIVREVKKPITQAAAIQMSSYVHLPAIPGKRPTLSFNLTVGREDYARLMVYKRKRYITLALTGNPWHESWGGRQPMCHDILFQHLPTFWQSPSISTDMDEVDEYFIRCGHQTLAPTEEQLADDIRPEKFRKEFIFPEKAGYTPADPRKNVRPHGWAVDDVIFLIEIEKTLRSLFGERDRSETDELSMHGEHRPVIWHVIVSLVSEVGDAYSKVRSGIGLLPPVHDALSREAPFATLESARPCLGNCIYGRPRDGHKLVTLWATEEYIAIIMQDPACLDYEPAHHRIYSRWHKETWPGIQLTQ